MTAAAYSLDGTGRTQALADLKGFMDHWNLTPWYVWKDFNTLWTAQVNQKHLYSVLKGQWSAFTEEQTTLFLRYIQWTVKGA